jgi:hypothetical protein
MPRPFLFLKTWGEFSVPPNRTATGALASRTSYALNILFMAATTRLSSWVKLENSCISSIMEVLIFVRFREANTFLPPRFEFMLLSPPAILDASDTPKVPNFLGQTLIGDPLRVFLPVGHEIGLRSRT